MGLAVSCYGDARQGGDVFDSQVYFLRLLFVGHDRPLSLAAAYSLGAFMRGERGFSGASNLPLGGGARVGDVGAITARADRGFEVVS